jgi:uncharacterized membrane protein YciS (DUF1049 family)
VIIYACVFALGYALGVVIGAFQYGVRVTARALERRQP